MQLNLNHIHIWSATLTLTSEEEQKKLDFLDLDEKKRAQRLHSALNKQRFIAAHSILRQLLGRYLNIAPEKLLFAYTEHRKPYLVDHPILQFNMAHSNDRALYAITLNHAVGIDIEKMRKKYNPAIVKRYFSPTENQAFNVLPEQEKIAAFYRIWARKEALIKANGRGLHLPLNTFSVAIDSRIETILLEQQAWTLLSLNVASDYQAALASNQIIKQISYWNFFDQN